MHMKFAALAFALTSAGCRARLPNAASEACYLRTALGYQERAAQCETEQCIDDLEPEFQKEQEACP
jgi:hypothetical protein